MDDNLPATSTMGVHPLICVGVKSNRNIKNGFTPMNMLKSLYADRMCFN